MADVAVFRAGPIGDRIPSVPPFLVVEIMSAEDRMERMVPKIEDYLSIGVEFVWIIDPARRNSLCFTPSDRAGSPCDPLRTQNPDIEIPLAALLAEEEDE